MTKPFCYRNRRDVAFYLHRGTTKTGKARFFFAKTIGEGAIDALPKGYEVTESVNGVVSVRRAVPSAIPPADVALVREALARDERLRVCVVETKGDAIIVHEPERVGLFGDESATLSRMLGLSPARLAAYRDAMAKKARYAPVMKFEPAFVGKTREGQYLALRRTYRGEGGWLALSTGPLRTLATKYLAHIGRESFFDLF